MAGQTPTRWVTGVLLMMGLLVALLTFTASFMTEFDVDYLNETWANLSTSVSSLQNSDDVVGIYTNVNESLGSWQDPDLNSYGAVSYWDRMIQSLAIAGKSLSSVGDIGSQIAYPSAQAVGLTDSDAGQTLVAMLLVCLVVASLFMILRAMTGRDL